MKIEFKLYASLGDYLPAAVRHENRMPLEVRENAPISEIIEPFGLPQKMVHLVLVNGVYVPPEQRMTHQLKEGDVLAIWPPIAGG
ncbi:MAG: MoaD/ThiS family protein [Rubrivivax sp.]|nr:MoaD/ThiS family protein [Rubrivivax sp.]